MTEPKIKLAHIFSLLFVALIFAFSVFMFVPGEDDGLLADSVQPSSNVAQSVAMMRAEPTAMMATGLVQASQQ